MIVLSIVTINLNNKHGLARTLESVFNQKFQGIELIVVDGGSTDGSVELIQDNQHRIAVTIVGMDTGIYNAMNMGIQRCQGRYVHILNSGDIYTSSSILSSLNFSGQYSFICTAVKKHSPKEFIWFPLVALDGGFVDVAHPGLIVKRDIYIGRGYSEKYRVVSDSLFIYQNVVPELSFITNQVLVEMQPGGISTKASVLHELERQRLFWFDGYRREKRSWLSFKSLLVFFRSVFKQIWMWR
jgi:glycosyltransferase involved in cell wall biosynthesis